MAICCRDIDWSSLRFCEEAVLCLIRNKNHLLLIHKKKGLGAGKINAPGGRIEPAEQPTEAAVREVREEVGLTVYDLHLEAELQFVFINGYSLRGFVFGAMGYRGTPISTAEAIPFWCAIDEIPYGRMWADDFLWLPRVIAGETVLGRFVFNGDHMLDAEVKPLLPVTCAIVYHREKYLVAQRPPSMSRPLKWEFPGGKIERNETPEACVVREIREELGVTVRPLFPLPIITYSYDERAIALMPFMCEMVCGEPRPAEHHAVRWVTIDEMPTLDWCEADRIVMRMLLNYKADAQLGLSRGTEKAGCNAASNCGI